jgi:hypothetical protein
LLKFEIYLLISDAYGGRIRSRTRDPLIKSQLLFSMIDVTRVITGCRAKHDRTISQLLPIVWIRQLMDDVEAAAFWAATLITESPR